MLRKAYVAILATGFALAACSLSGAAEPLKVSVSIAPQATFVERVGADRVDVQVLVPPAGSPATYSPTPGQVSRLSQSRLFFRIWVPFENGFIPRIASTLQSLDIVDLREGIESIDMQGHGHDHGHGHGHGEGKDPHVWLDPLRVARMAETIRDALSKADPEGAALYARNCRTFQKDLRQVDRELASALAGLKGRKLYVFHPAYGYFADRYGLRQVAVEQGGKSPSPRQLAALIEKARHDKVRVIFVQPQFDRRAAQVIADSIDGAVVALDPLARDYVANLRAMAREIGEALGKE